MADKTIILDRPDQIAYFRMRAIEMAARYRAQGIMLTSKAKMPTIKQLRQQYPDILGGCKTWQNVADTMKAYLDEFVQVD